MEYQSNNDLKTDSLLWRGFISALSNNNKTNEKVPKGIYLYGTVGLYKFYFIIKFFKGCGKTMLMDLFYEHVLTKKKKRVHFHSFMQRFHKGFFKIFKIF